MILVDIGIDAGVQVRFYGGVEGQNLYEALGRRIAARRRTLGITQGTLASRIDFTRATIASIEAGRQRVTLDQLYQLGSALDLDTVSDLIPIEFPERTTAEAPLEREVNAIQASQVNDLVRAAIESARVGRKRN